MRNRKTPMKTLWMRVTGTSSYNRFDDDGDDADNDQEKDHQRDDKNENEEKPKKKTGISDASKNDETNKKKKRKGWKRLRHAALVTCRYIGLGVSHMSPISTYPPGDYNLDPYGWCVSMNTMNGKTQPPHWTTGIILNGW